MSDDNGSAAGGQPGGAGAAGDKGGAAPWYGAEAGDDIKGFVELKGWPDAKSAVQSYRDLERLLGADKAGRGVIWPKDEADAEGWSAIYQRMGRPAAADGYKLPVPEGDPGTFAKAFAPILHELGLSQRQAEGLAGKWNEYQKAELDKLDAKVQEEIAKEQADLRREWGAAHAQNSELARRSAVALGMSEDDVADLVAAAGWSKSQKWLAKVGEALGEDKFAGADGRPANRAYTPAAARARLEQLMGDQAWLNRFASGDAEALAEKNRLDEAILAGRAA